MNGYYLRLPEEAIEMLDALAPHIGEVHPGRVGRTSVILALLRGDDISRYANDPKVSQAIRALGDALDRSRL